MIAAPNFEVASLMRRISHRVHTTSGWNTSPTESFLGSCGHSGPISTTTLITQYDEW